MRTHARVDTGGLTIGPWSGVGAGIGLIFALLAQAELPMGLVVGAAVGLLIGLVVDALAWRREEPDVTIRHPLGRN
jgi:hypothetical protein